MVKTTDDCLGVNISALNKYWCFKKLSKTNAIVNGQTRWSRNGEVYSRIDYTINFNSSSPFIQFSYVFNGESISYKVMLTFTQPYYGGKRWWFMCPLSGGRCGALYLSDAVKKFVAHKAFKHLPYKSQNECVIGRAIRRKNRLGERYGATNNDSTYFPRPKGMHTKTYHERLSRLNKLMYKADSMIMARLNAMI